MPTGPNLESWRYWWAFNKDRFLRLREAVSQPGGVATPSPADDVLSGRAVQADFRPSLEQLNKEVLPALFEILEKETNPDIVTATMISVGKVGEESTRAVEEIQKKLRHANSTVCENAALSLGILGSGAALVPLKALFEDSDEGRALCNKKEVPWRVRTLAAYGLGLLGSQTKNPHFQAKIQEVLLAPFGASAKKSAQKDVAVAAAIALGMMPDRDQHAALTLQKYYQQNLAREETICAHVPSTVARALGPAPAADRERYAVAMLDAIQESKSTPRNARPALALALGQITRSNDPFAKNVEKALRASMDTEMSRNPEMAFLGLISLGEIASGSEPGNEIESFLLEKAMARGGRVATRAWAALALGVEGFGQSQRNALTGVDRIAVALSEQMAEIRDPEQQAAFAIALGLRKATFASAACTRLLDSVKVDDFRGYFAVALGMMRSHESAKKIHELVKDSVRRPALFQQGAIALALLGEKAVVTSLIAILRDPKNQGFTVQSAVADALGYVGDHRAVTPLVELLRDEKATTSGRTFASVALGQMCDKDSVPWNARISAHLNYFAFVETLTDLIWEM
jgi:HEAT repeat protein